MFDLVCFGEPLVGIYPADRRNRKLCRLAFGGDTSNVALAAARLGLRVGYLTAVGSDAYGDEFLQLWQHRGVDTSLVSADPERPTGLYVLSFGKDQKSHRFSYYRAGSAASALRYPELPLDAALNTRVLHVSGISQAISPTMLEAGFLLMQAARQRGVVVSYDVNYRRALWGVDAAGAVAHRTIHQFADIVSTNTEELQGLRLAESEDELFDTLASRAQLVAVRRGSEGASVSFRGKRASSAPFHVEVEDTVGAGDAFDAALIASFLWERTAEETVEFASAVAALTCRGVGPTDMQPTEEEAMEFVVARKASGVS